MRVLPAEAARYLAMGREEFRGDRTPAGLHRLRLAGKRLRYTLELFGETYGTSLQEILTPLKALQDLLGAISDCDASENLIHNAGLESAGGATELLEAIRDGRETRLRAFLEAWRVPAVEAAPERRWPEILGNPEPRRPGERP